MRPCVTRYRIELRLVERPNELRVAYGIYREIREPGAQGEPGWVVSRQLFHLILDGNPAWLSHTSIEAAVGGPYTVVGHDRVDGSRWVE
jgi:hypothetical protein